MLLTNVNAHRFHQDPRSICIPALFLLEIFFFEANIRVQAFEHGLVKHRFEDVQNSTLSGDIRIHLESRPKSVVTGEDVDINFSRNIEESDSEVTWLRKAALNKHPRAVCNDGSPAAYYFRRGSLGSSFWLVHLEVDTFSN